MFKFQLLSDIHTELKPFNLSSLIPKCDNLFLAGDLGKPASKEYLNLLNYTSKNWKNVFLIAGNHEFYKSSYHDTIKTKKENCQQFDNIHFLNRNKIILNNVKILGCTLWSNIPKIHSASIQDHINDYHLIRDPENNYKKIDTDYTNNLHSIDLKWLESELQINEHTACGGYQATIVITHHAPSFNNTCDPKYIGKFTNYAFCTNLEYLFKNVNIWIFGHTHWNTNTIIKNTRLISNQYGYSQLERARFNFETVFELKTDL